MNKSTASELIKKLKIGWNFGNTLDAPNGETSWGNPVITAEMIRKIHSLGFETLRLPVSWHRHVDADFNIYPDWLARIAEIINYAYSDGMYVIINIHHDDHLFAPTAEGFEVGKKYIFSIWRQLSERLESFGERLIFESMNEPRMLRHKYEWNLNLKEKVCLDAVEYINRYNQIFVDTVRSAGGYNKTRFLMTPSYAAAPRHTYIPAFRLADDPTDRIVISVHSYEPVDLCLLPEREETVFDKASEAVLERTFSGLKKRFTDNSVPVVIGEMGMIDKHNPDDRRRWSEFFVKKARESGMAALWWDNGLRDFRLFDRRNLCIYDGSKPVYEGLFKGLGQ